MPVYDYECKDCGKAFNVVTSMTEHEKQQKHKKVRCPKCNGLWLDAGELEQIIHEENAPGRWLSVFWPSRGGKKEE